MTPNDWRLSVIEPSSGVGSEGISPDRKVRRFVGTVPLGEGQTNQVMNTDANENEFMLISAIKTK